MRITLAFHKDSLELDLGSHDDIKILRGNLSAPAPDTMEELRRAIELPIGSPTLRSLVPPEGTISILVSDITRSAATGRLLLALLSCLEELGATPDRVQIALALGMHRGHCREEIETHLGREVVSRWRTFEHDARDGGSLVSVGTTSAGTPCLFNKRVAESSFAIVLGSLSFHYFAGFGGARKLILPGIAGERTIKANHRLSLKDDPRDGLSEGCRPGNIDGNPVHDDMLEGARLLPLPVFAINSITDDAGKIVHINAGDLDLSHRAGCELLIDRFRLPIERPYRAAIVSPGGYPKDMNLLQSHKAIRHASYALTDGGIMMIAAACPEGIGSESLADAFRNGRDSVPAAVAGRYTINGQAALSLHELTGKHTILLKSMMDDDETVRFGFEPWELRRSGELLDGIADEDVCIIPEAATYLPVRV